MMIAMMIVCTVAAIAQLIIIVGCTIVCLRSPEPTREEIERADMRSSSWPTGYDN
jgi:hypothetical protein